MLDSPLWTTAPEELGGSHLVQGPAGSGKTRFIIDQAARYLTQGLDPEGLLVLAPTRVAADRLKSGINAASSATISTVPVRTWSSYAFHLISRAFQAGLTHWEDVDPKLLTGADQDAIIKTIVEGSIGRLHWPSDLGEALHTAGFRKEVREFFDRMQEYGLDEHGLQQLCQRHTDTPQMWEALGALFTDYTQTMHLEEAGRFDPAALISTAVAIMGTGEANLLSGAGDSDAFVRFYNQERDRLKLLLVDDLQEANPAMHQLLAIVGKDKDVIAVGCADTVVQGFRGARPELLNTPGGTLGWTRKIQVSHSHTLAGDIAQAYRNVTASIGTVGDAAASRLTQLELTAEHKTPRTEVALTASESEQNQLVLSYVLNWLKGDQQQQQPPVPLSEQAIIVRNGSQVQTLARFLRAEGVPVRTIVSDMVLVDEPAVAGLLRLLKVAIELAAQNEPELSSGVLEPLLVGDYIGMTNLQVRTLRKQILRRPATETATANIAQDTRLLIGTARERLAQLATMALQGELAGEATQRIPEHLREPYQQWSSFAPLRKLVTVLCRTIDSLRDPSQFAEDTLWEIWSATGVAEIWKERSTKAGAEGLQANHDLDAVVTLFQVAKRFQDQNLAATALQFLQHLEALELPTDSLSRAGQHSDSIAVLTAAAAAGLHFSHVIVAGLQQGRWPNEQPRGTLLGSTELVEVLEGRPHLGQEAQLARRHAVRNDELRSFATAISRATRKLVTIAVAADDQQPSTFLQYVPNEGEKFDSEHAQLTEVPVPPTPHQLVAELRRKLRSVVTSTEDINDSELEYLVEILGYLTREPYPELAPAHPDRWWGVADRSTSEPLHQPGDLIRLSPSRIESLTDNPVSWLYDMMGDDTAANESDLNRHVGTMVHALAETYPEGSHAELEAAAEKLMANLAFSGFFGQRMRDRISGMIKAMADYFRSVSINRAEVLAVEAAFKHQQQIDENEVVLSGIIDRLEKTADGGIRIVDYKTGKKTPSGPEVKAHIQLALYQLAYNAGAVQFGQQDSLLKPGKLPIEKATIVQVGHEGITGPSSYVRDQPPLDQAPVNPESLISLATKLLLQSSFAAVSTAKTYEQEDHERLPENPSGTQVTE